VEGGCFLAAIGAIVILLALFFPVLATCHPVVAVAGVLAIVAFVFLAQWCIARWYYCPPHQPEAENHDAARGNEED